MYYKSTYIRKNNCLIFVSGLLYHQEIFLCNDLYKVETYSAITAFP